jgi:hypothetical protein
LKIASDIWLRPALCMQMNRTVTMLIGGAARSLKVHPNPHIQIT